MHELLALADNSGPGKGHLELCLDIPGLVGLQRLHCIALHYIARFALVHHDHRCQMLADPLSASPRLPRGQEGLAILVEVQGVSTCWQHKQLHLLLGNPMLQPDLATVLHKPDMRPVWKFHAGCPAWAPVDLSRVACNGIKGWGGALMKPGTALAGNLQKQADAKPRLGRPQCC